MLEVPIHRLSADALQNLIEDFVTREGRNHDQDEFSAAQMVEQVRRQLDDGELAVVYDERDASCTILPRSKID